MLEMKFGSSVIQEQRSRQSYDAAFGHQTVPMEQISLAL